MVNRDKSIDIAKGLLILGVVWFHMKTILIESCGIEHSMFVTLYTAHKVYAVFFMPAFFFITGYCSNFYKTFKDFLVSNVKGIIVPMVILNVVACALTFSLEGLKYLVAWSNWLYGLSFWFLPTLFVAKMMFWPICRYVHGRVVFILTIIAFFIGSIALNNIISVHNYWYWKNALAYSFFIGAGYLFKHEVPEMLRLSCMRVGSILYALLLSIVLYMDLPVWYLGLSLSCTYSQMPFFLVIATCGSLAIMHVASLISRNVVLEYMGKASLVIYCTHWFIGQHLGKYLSWFFLPDSNVKATMFYSLVVVTTIICCCIFNHVYKKMIERRFLS